MPGGIIVGIPRREYFMLKYKRSFFRLSYLICIFIILLVGISVYRKNLIYDKLTISYDNKEVKYGNKVT